MDSKNKFDLEYVSACSFRQLTSKSLRKKTINLNKFFFSFFKLMNLLIELKLNYSKNIVQSFGFFKIMKYLNFLNIEQYKKMRINHFPSILYLILCLATTLTLTLRVRKNLNKVSPAEYNQYHILLRMLFICQPDHVEKKIIYYISLNNSQQIALTPQSLYDVLVGMHSSSCAHGSEFFPYWHRSYLDRFESYLEKSHDYLIQLYNNSNYLQLEAERLRKIAIQNTLNPNLTDIQDYLTKTAQDYNKIINMTPIQDNPKGFIAAHYWNVMNYTQKIEYPKGFYRKKLLNNQNKTYFDRNEWDNQLINADKLISLIYDQEGIFQINFKTRWYRNQIKTALSRDSGALYNIFKVPPTICQAEELIQDEQFWASPDHSQSLYKRNIANWLFDNVVPGTKPISNILFEYLNRKQQGRRYSTVFDTAKMQLNTFDSFDVNFVFGGKGNQFIKDDGIIAKLRNSILPYFMYAKSLKTKPYDFIGKFCGNTDDFEYSIENSHDFMHNYQIKMISDPKFSPLSPIFFAYHSFVDIMLQIKIKMINSNNDVSGQVNSLVDAVAGVTEFMEKDLGPSNSFQQFWARKFIKQAEPKNRDIPVFLWKRPKLQSQQVTEHDFISPLQPQSSQTLKYYDLIVYDKKGKKRLRELEQYKDASYDFDMNNRSDPFVASLHKIIDLVPSPYPQEKTPHLSLRVSFNPEKITEKELLIKLKNLKGRVLDIKYILRNNQSKQKKQVSSRIINFDMLKIDSNYAKKLRRMVSTKDDVLNTQKIFPQIRPSQLFSLQISDENAEVTYRQGRMKVEVIIKGMQKQEKVLLRVKYRDERQIGKKTKIKQYTLEPEDQKQTYGKKGYLIQSIQSILISSNRKKVIEHIFCLFAEQSEVILNYRERKKKIRLIRAGKQK